MEYKKFNNGYELVSDIITNCLKINNKIFKIETNTNSNTYFSLSIKYNLYFALSVNYFNFNSLSVSSFDIDYLYNILYDDEHVITITFCNRDFLSKNNYVFKFKVITNDENDEHIVEDYDLFLTILKYIMKG